MKKFEYKVKVWNNIDSNTITLIDDSKHREDEKAIGYAISKIGHDLRYDFKTPPDQHTISGKVLKCTEVD